MVNSNEEVPDVTIKMYGNSCKVEPGEFIVESGGEEIVNKINFYNETSGLVKLLFSEVCLHLDPADKVNPSTVDIEQGEIKGIPIRKVQRGIYPYAVYCECCNDFATASSMPIIIIRK
jgi:uncharacterized protein YlzI (FlbEa/FlbD family)